MILNEKYYNNLTSDIIKCCLEVHKELGPGLLESIYEECCVKEFKNSGLNIKRQVPLKILYKGEEIQKELFIDLLIEDKIILELKTVEKLLPIHEAQLLTYLKLANKKLGLLINFNSVLLKDGIKRKINGYIPL